MANYPRRKFLQQFLKGSTLAAIYPWMTNLQEGMLELDLEDNEERYWKKVRKQYRLSKEFIDFNNAGVNPSTKSVQDAVAYYEKMSNEIPSYYMWQKIDKEKALVKDGLAELMGCNSDDIAIQRNTTEAIETIIFGLPLKRGDQVVLSRQDYPHIKFAWRQREKRDGIFLNWIQPTLPSSDPTYLFEQYKEKINPQTKVVCITHITSWNGQVLPLKEIATYAKAQGADVLVDAAHTLGQRPINIQELDIDYLASSLHKWVGAPFGTGVLYVRKEKRKDIYPLFAGPNAKSKGMHKFEHLGTRAVSHERAILPALVFCKSIGVERKMKRLQFLKEYIVNKIKDLPKLNIHSPVDMNNGSAILLFSIDGSDNQVLSTKLRRNWSIHTTTSENENLSGVRISPNVFTQISELDTFVEAIKALTKYQ